MDKPRLLDKKMFGGKAFTYPTDHKMGMKVPYGGSMCGNCIFLGKEHITCTQKEWIKWNNGDDKLPEKDEEYCCDLWEKGKVHKDSKKEETKEEKLRKFTR